MKITLLGPAHPYRGGIAEFSNRLALQLTGEGHNVDICTFKLQYPRFLFPGKTQYTDSVPPKNIRIRRLVNSVNPFNWIITGFRIRRERPDILLIRYWLPFMAPCLGTIARIARRNRYQFTKVICIFDNVIPHEKRACDKLFTRYFVRSIDGAVVMSQTVFDELHHFRKSFPVVLNPHPLFDNYGDKINKDHALKQLNLDPEYSYLLFFGFIRAYKGLDLLLEALSDERLRNRKLKLIVAGEFYEEKDSYFELVRKYKIENDVIIHNRFIDNNEVPLFFSAADLVVQPYKSATQSGVTQIAFHYDTPMLVTDVGGLREVVTDMVSGYVVNPDPDEIAGALNDYFDNNRKESFKKGVREGKERFSWNNMTAAITEVFLKTLLGQIIKSMGK
jgi:glycosyltransferase involved in cell wall biosynthesis